MPTTPPVRPEPGDPSAVAPWAHTSPDDPADHRRPTGGAGPSGLSARGLLAVMGGLCAALGVALASTPAWGWFRMVVGPAEARVSGLGRTSTVAPLGLTTGFEGEVWPPSDRLWMLGGLADGVVVMASALAVAGLGLVLALRCGRGWSARRPGRRPDLIAIPALITALGVSALVWTALSWLRVEDVIEAEVRRSVTADPVAEAVLSTINVEPGPGLVLAAALALVVIVVGGLATVTGTTAAVATPAPTPDGARDQELA